MRNIFILITLTWLTFPTFCQDTLDLPVIRHNGNVGLFVDSASAYTLAHKLEEGDLATKELAVCDSIGTLKDSINLKQKAVIANLNASLSIASRKESTYVDIIKINEEKYVECDRARRKARRQRFIWGGAGIIGGIVGGLLIK